MADVPAEPGPTPVVPKVTCKVCTRTEVIPKIIEVTLAAICLMLHAVTDKYSPIHATEGVASTTFVAYLIIPVGLIIGIGTKDPVPMVVELVYNILGCLLFFISGGVLLGVDAPHYPNTQQTLQACGSLAIINGFVLIGDVVMVFMGRRQDTVVSEFK